MLEPVGQGGEMDELAVHWLNRVGSAIMNAERFYMPKINSIFCANDGCIRPPRHFEFGGKHFCSLDCLLIWLEFQNKTNATCALETAEGIAHEMPTIENQSGID